MSLDTQVESHLDAAGPPARGRPGRMGSAWVAVAAVALTPILVVLLLRLPLVNQLNYADAWFYSGYGWAPKHEFALFGWTYFSVRFPAILAIGAFQRVFGAGGGYVLLRYLLVVASGASVYLCVRRFASAGVGAVAVVLLYLNPFFSRMLLWDYSGFMEVAGATCGIALWFWSDGRRLWWTLLPGAALACAVFANALVGTGVLVLLLVEGAHAVRQGRSGVRLYALRVGVAAAAGVGVFALGYLAYLAILGSISPYDLLRPTIKFFGENSQQSAQYQRPVSSWLFHEPRIWGPVLLALALLATLRGRILAAEIESRVALVFVAYVAFLWLYRFTVTSSVIETWWGYDVLAVSMGPAVGVLLRELSRSVRRTWWIVALICLGAAILFVRDLPGPAGHVYHSLSSHEALLLVVLAVGVALAAATGWLPAKGRGLAAAGLAVVVAIALYAPSILDARGTTGVFVTSGSEEWKAYKAGQQFLDLVQDYDGPAHRVYLWYPGTLGPVDVAWSDLPQYGDTVDQLGVDEGPALSTLGRARLVEPQVHYALLFAPDRADVLARRRSLQASGFPAPLVREGQLGGGVLSYQLVAIR